MPSSAYKANLEVMYEVMYVWRARQPAWLTFFVSAEMDAKLGNNDAQTYRHRATFRLYREFQFAVQQTSR